MALASSWASLHLLIFFFSYRFLLIHARSIQAGIVNGSFYSDFLLSMEIMCVYLLYIDFNIMMFAKSAYMTKKKSNWAP